MSRPVQAVIHLDNLRHNLALMRRLARDRTLWAVVKADAYGHGLEQALTAFAEADGLATLEVRDARFFREHGWSRRILLLEGFFDADELVEIGQLGLETVVHSSWQIDLLRRTPIEKGVNVHVKLNSGMNRLGFKPEEYGAVRAELEAIAGVRVLGCVTHFANSEASYAADGILPVNRQLSAMGQLACRKDACMANSGALLFHEEVTGGAVRAGVALYGLSPDSRVDRDTLGLKAGMTLEARIIAVQHINAGDAVGYGSRWTAKRASRIAVVTCGYGDGYPRSMPDGAPVWVCGRKVPLVGSVSMDMLEIDITDVPEADVGETVELWGEHIDVNTLASLVGTIGYELICAVAPRVPRVSGGR